jgi:hypothetical protein
MSSYKTTEDVVMTVTGLLAFFTIPVHMGTKPLSERSGKFIVVNAFEIGADVMQKCRVNVNYYVRDIEPGIKDTVAIQGANNLIINALDGVTVTDDYLIDFEGQETIPDENNDYHYSNIKFSYKQINS